MQTNNNKITTDLDLTVQLLKAGAIVAFPTETVYGLGADATNPAAIQQVFAAKGRPADHPLIVHIGTIEQLTLWAKDIPATALQLAQQFWPGPLTLILNKQPQVSSLITGGQDTIAIRMPQHPLALQLLQRFGSALVGPSANRYGRVSPTTAQHVANDLGAAVAAILDGDQCSVGIESTIVDLTGNTTKILRSGAITAAAISQLLQQDVTVMQDADRNMRSPGDVASHYAPLTKVLLLTQEELSTQAATLVQKFSVLSFQAKPQNLNDHIYWQQVARDPKNYAHDLYANLRKHDQLQNDLLLIERPPYAPEWLAILDRLTRASA